nr:EOG090X03KG [Sida crystallina]
MFTVHSSNQLYTSSINEKDQHLLLAFGDFNGDKLTDAFIIEKDLKSLRILLAHDKPPFLRSTPLTCSFEKRQIVALVPGDFDGDASMDILILTKYFISDPTFNVYIAWGSLNRLECPDDKNPVLTITGHPLVLDYNGDFISDLFGYNSDNKRTFWIFGSNRSASPTEIHMESSDKALRIPHSHGFVDLDGDMNTDLLLTGQTSYELWSYNYNMTFELTKIIELPVKDAAVIGQSVFIDVNFDGVLDHLVPVCVDSKCLKSSFYIYTNDKWLQLECDLQQVNHPEKQWTFHPPASDGTVPFYQDTVTVRAGDFNLDGYPDLLVTLVNTNSPKHNPELRAVLLENNPCSDCTFGRRLDPNWNVLSEWNTSVSMAAFYDVQENGVLDVLLAHQVGGELRLAAYKNALDYDANFIKVLVLTGRCYSNCTHGQIPYGTNLPGPVVAYQTTKANGDLQLARSAQLSQSAYQSLQLPYSLFGLGHTPNFVEVLRVGILHPDPTRRSREWTQIIPNSQMIIIPNLSAQPRKWLNKLFVTPSRAIVLSAAALGGFGFFLALVVAGLHCRERQDDKREKLSQAYRFHFDAM